MVLGAIGDTGYNVMLLVHVLAMFVAFAPSFVWPFVARTLRSSGGEEAAAVVSRLREGTSQKIYGPALAIGGLVGFGVAGMSEKVYAMSQTWLVVAALLWLIMLGIYFGLMAPAEKKLAEGDRSVEKMIAMSNGIIHLLVVVSLYLMVFKPGYP